MTVRAWSCIDHEREPTGPRRRRWLHALPLAVVITLAPVAGSACGDDGEEPGGVEASAELREGAEVYGARCASCHGRDGDGGSGPALGDGRVAERYPEIADHIAVVRDGRRGMPAWEDILTPEEIEAVVRYEREGL
jgi:mono/diheme cytochrome c family protein